jgi:hypothetical protein
MDDETQSVHRLAPLYVHDINSPLRHVRTRIYFTSESHIHSLVNILRHEHLDGKSLLSDEARARLDSTTEFDYLTQIVFRMYENKLVWPLVWLMAARTVDLQRDSAGVAVGHWCLVCWPAARMSGIC